MMAFALGVLSSRMEQTMLSLNKVYYVENLFVIKDNYVMDKDRLRNIGINIKSERLRKAISSLSLDSYLSC